MEPKKLEFNKSVSKIDSEREEFRGNFLHQKANTLTIELIEIYGIENPSQFTIKIINLENNKLKTIRIPLYRHRTDFIYQNNIFILDTISIEHFKLKVNQAYFSIELIYEKEDDFKLLMYYTTDQQLGLGHEYVGK